MRTKNPKKNNLNKVRSSIIGVNELPKFGEIVHRNTYENKNNNLYEIINKRKIKKIKSLDNIILNGKNIRKKNFQLDL